MTGSPRSPAYMRCSFSNLSETLGTLKQIHQVRFPHSSQCVRSVPGSLVGQWQHDRPAVSNALDVTLQDLQFRRIDEIIRRIDGDGWGGDPVEREVIFHR